MFLVPFIAVLFVLFLVFWVADIFFTLKTVGKVGNEVELNPIMSLLLKVRRRYLFLFKIAEIAVFTGLMLGFVAVDTHTALYVLFALTLAYSLIVAQGIRVYLNASGNPFPVSMLFLVVVLIAVFTIYVSYLSFVDTISISDALQKCNTEYIGAYRTCVANATGTVEPPKHFDINLTIPR